MVRKSGNYVDKDEMFTFAVLSIGRFFFHFFFFWCEHLVELKNKYPFFGFLHITGIAYKLSLHFGIG